MFLAYCMDSTSTNDTPPVLQKPPIVSEYEEPDNAFSDFSTYVDDLGDSEESNTSCDGNNTINSGTTSNYQVVFKSSLSDVQAQFKKWMSFHD